MVKPSKRTILVGCIGIMIVVCAELFARFNLGLGDPPILAPDSDIDYIFAPNQRCNRFGSRIVYNNCSMRCDFDCVVGESPDRKRIFVVGDSVVNGGSLTDHKNLATTIMQEKLDPSRSKIQVCNVSAGSWGPGNYIAYFRRYQALVGTNDVLVVELNSHDLWEDDPRLTGGANVGKDIACPNRKPCCALSDGFRRYFMPRLRRSLGMAVINTKVDVPRWEKDVHSASAEFNLAALTALYELPVCKRYLLVHRTREETKNDVESVGETAFRNFAASKGIPIIDLKLNDKDDFRDEIHLNESGQLKMASAIGNALVK